MTTLYRPALTLYRPVLIESAEQAEALPIGTVTITPNEVGQVDRAAVRVRGGWHSTGAANEHGTPFLYPHQAVVGDTALVPVEAEEETTGALVNRAGDTRWIASRRLVTPWEEA